MRFERAFFLVLPTHFRKPIGWPFANILMAREDKGRHSVARHANVAKVLPHMKLRGLRTRSFCFVVL